MCCDPTMNACCPGNVALPLGSICPTTATTTPTPTRPAGVVCGCVLPYVMGPGNTCVLCVGTVVNGVCQPSATTTQRPVTCQLPLVRGADNRCVCANGGTLIGRECVPPSRPVVCRPPLVPGPNNTCVPSTAPARCESPRVLINNTCECPGGGTFRDGRCEAPPRPVVCKPPLVPGPNNTCVPSTAPARCEPPRVLINNTCECPGGGTFRDGKCEAPSPRCPAGEERNADGKCVKPPAPCPSGEERNADGACVKKSTTTVACPDGEVRTLRGCEKPAKKPTKPAPTLRTTPPPKLNVKPPPKLNLAPKPILTLKPPPKKR